MSDERPRLKLDEDFTFACHKGLECYTSCCRDVTIMLTPYDVLRMKKALGLTSNQFLEKIHPPGAGAGQGSAPGAV